MTFNKVKNYEIKGKFSQFNLSEKEILGGQNCNAFMKWIVLGFFLCKKNRKWAYGMGSLKEASRKGEDMVMNDEDVAPMMIMTI